MKIKMKTNENDMKINENSNKNGNENLELKGNVYMKKTVEKEIQDYLNGHKTNFLKKAGLGTVIRSYYLGLDIDIRDRCEIDEAINLIGLSINDTILWKKLWREKLQTK